MDARVSRSTIGLNLLWMVPGVVGGSEEYTTRLLPAMAEHEPDDLELVLFVTGCSPTPTPSWRRRSRRWSPR